MKVHQIRISTKNIRYTVNHIRKIKGWLHRANSLINDAETLFEFVQNTYNLFDNCVLEYENKNPSFIVIEGHNRTQVEALLEKFKDNEIFNRLHYTIETRPYEDTVLGDKRIETGDLEVRDVEFYENLLEKILKIKELLPMFIGKDRELDKLIAEELKGN